MKNKGQNVAVQSIIDMAARQVKMKGLYGADPVSIDEFIFVEAADGDICQLDEQELEEYIDVHQDQDFVVLRVRESVVKFIEDSSEKNPENYTRPELTVGDMKALAFMHDNMGELYCEVLRSYTHFVQDGMRVETAVYAAMLAWDLNIDGVQS